MKNLVIMRLRLISLLALLAGLALACGGQTAAPSPQSEASDSGPTRPFLLGFTPFPFDLNAEALEYVYNRMAEDADIVAHHFDSGVPWPEALAGDDFNTQILNDWSYRKGRTPPGHKMYVAITPINTTRDNLALYNGATGNMPLPAPWDQYAFNHPDVKSAYFNYAVRVVEFFEPDYLAIGIESNLLAVKRDDLWPGYLELHQEVYSQLKQRYSDLPIFVSLLGTTLLDGYQAEADHAQQGQVLEEILPYTDYFGISLYPYLTTYLANEIPETMWEDLFSLSEKPIAITETGYAAEYFTLAGGSFGVNGSPEKQAAYIERLLEEAQEREFVFVINFVLRDFDALFEAVPEEYREIALPWRDSGLYNGEGQARLALESWLAALARPYAPVD